MKSPKNVREAMRLLIEHEKSVRCFYDDPMTQAMGVDTGDFQDGFDREQRSLAAYICNHSVVGSRRYQFAFGILEQFMP